uniref:Secreted protein n=1 Tax=Triticum urartu TaxID=4572 RepID=A0A8R7P2L1_TRIUA
WTHLPPPAGRRRPTFVLWSGALLVCCCPTTSSVACVPRHQEPPPKSMVTPLHSGLALWPVTLPIRRFGAVESPAIPLWRASASSTSIASHPCSLVPALHRLEQTKKEKTLMQWFRCREISVQKREVR